MIPTERFSSRVDDYVLARPGYPAAVVAAQSFHWFDRAAFRAECTRILRPGGIVALLWNVRRVEGSTFGAGYEALLRTFATDYLTVRHENVADEEIAAFFGGPGCCRRPTPPPRGIHGTNRCWPRSMRSITHTIAAAAS